MTKHPGFAAVASSIAAREGYSKERAGSILAARTRKASPTAKRKNPNLKHVLMAHTKQGNLRKG